MPNIYKTIGIWHFCTIHLRLTILFAFLFTAFLDNSSDSLWENGRNAFILTNPLMRLLFFCYYCCQFYLLLRPSLTVPLLIIMGMFSKKTKALQKLQGFRTVVVFGNFACRLLFSYSGRPPLMQMSTVRCHRHLSIRQWNRVYWLLWRCICSILWHFLCRRDLWMWSIN
jgi:hypothetical protein